MSVSVPTGVQDTISRLNRQMKACPEQKFAIVGYSQGAAVMHSAAVKFDPTVMPKIVAAVMFGDPSFRKANGFPDPIQTKLKENCNPGDPVSRPTSSFDIGLLTPVLTGVRSRRW
jgi:cutinase